jgi:hypothetical protein
MPKGLIVDVLDFRVKREYREKRLIRTESLWWTVGSCGMIPARIYS